MTRFVVCAFFALQLGGCEMPGSVEEVQSVTPLTYEDALRENGSSLTNSVGMKLQLIPNGDYLMGLPESEKFSFVEKNQNHVRITKPFYLSTTEVTQDQWEQVMNTTPWNGLKDVVEAPNNAASYISWENATEFCRRLSEMEGRRYRLPTEAEWEYSCRAGTTLIFHFGVNFETLKDYAWYEENASDLGERYPHEVATKKPNCWGLYDMLGNTWEWCGDRYKKDLYQTSMLSDPKGPQKGESRVLRGGSFMDANGNCLSAYRRGGNPASSHANIGFRVVCEVASD